MKLVLLKKQLNCVIRLFLVAGICLLIPGIGGCVDYGYPTTSGIKPISQIHKYSVRIRESSGRYRDDGELGPGDKLIYVYYFRSRELSEISSDREFAFAKLLENRSAVKPPCLSGYRVIKFGEMENGYLAVVVECVEK